MVGVALAMPETPVAALHTVESPVDEPTPRLQLSLVPSPRLATREDLPPAIAAFVESADRDIAAGRLESALDQTLGALAEVAGWLPLAMRHAELLLATERYAQAVRLVNAIEAMVPGDVDADYALDLERLRTHAFPTPESVRHLAGAALASGRAELIDSYVPAAIEIAAQQADAQAALELARAWAEQQPDNWHAAVTLALELVADGRLIEAAPLIAGIPPQADLQTLLTAVAVAAVVDAQQQWTLAQQLWDRLRQSRTSRAEIQAQVERVTQRIGSHASLQIHQGLIELAAGEAIQAERRLLTVRPPDLPRAYAAILGGSAAAILAHDDETAAAALKRAVQLHLRPELAEFAARVNVVPGGRSLVELGNELVERLVGRGETERAAELLESLTQAAPKDAAIAKQYAELLDSTGHQARALERLQELLARQEQAKDSEGLQQTLRAMLQIDPADDALRGRLIDEYMRRGNLEGVVEERCNIADHLTERGEQSEALTQLKQALDVASLTTSWRSLEAIFNRTVRLAPTDIDLRHRAVTSAIEHGKIGEAVRHLWDVVRICSDNLDVDETIAALHQIIALAPNDSDAYHRLGEALAAIGEYQQAERVYRRLQLLLPDDPGVRAKQVALAALAREQE